MRILEDLDFTGCLASGLGKPVQLDDAARLAELLENPWKAPVVVASATQVGIASPGVTIDGVTLAADDRVLLMGQTNPAENGVYLWVSGAAPMVRTIDAESGELLSQAVVSVRKGTHAGKTYKSGEVETIEVSPVAWAEVGSSGPKKAVRLVGDGVQTSFTVTHDLNTTEFTYTVYEAGEPVMASLVPASANTATLALGGYVPGVNGLKVVMVG